MGQPAPFFLSFAQFLDAPREGKLLDELRRLPKRPLTVDEVQAQLAVDQAREALDRLEVGHLAGERYGSSGLKGAKLKAWVVHNRAQEAQAALWRALREGNQRWIYDQAVKAGIIVPPQANDDPRGDLEKLQKKAEREAKREADKLLAQSGSMPPPPRMEAEDPVVDAALDFVEDTALDFVEDGVGRFYFKEHWAKHRSLARVAAWLKEYGYGDDPSVVMVELDRLAQAGLWRS